MLKLFSKLIKTSIKLIFLLLAIAGLFYLDTSIYTFPENQKFSGDSIFNPYQNIGTKFYKANFHTHAESYGGITNGKQVGDSIKLKYYEQGYDIASISDYQKINKSHPDSSKLFIPAYEHGYNIMKAHKLLINPTTTSFFDFPLFQTVHHKQRIVERLKKTGGLIAIAHPEFMHGHTETDLQKMTGYDFIEVLNHYRLSVHHWDSVLSVGKLSFLLANDDSHDITKTHNTFVMWNMIAADSYSQSSVITALQKGMSYGVHGSKAINENMLDYCMIRNDSLFIKTTAKADELVLIGQKGKRLLLKKNSDSISFPVSKDASYIRAEIETKGSRMYLNPVIRYDGKQLPLASSYQAEINYPASILIKILILIIELLLLSFIFSYPWKKLHRKHKLPFSGNQD